MVSKGRGRVMFALVAALASQSTRRRRRWLRIATTCVQAAVARCLGSRESIQARRNCVIRVGFPVRPIRRRQTPWRSQTGAGLANSRSRRLSRINWQRGVVVTGIRREIQMAECCKNRTLSQSEHDDSLAVPFISSTGCARCGMCCEVLPLDVNRQKMERMRLNASADAFRDLEFMLRHFHRISRTEAFKRNPFFRARGTRKGVYYTCDQYDAQNHLCLAQENKPRTCSEFPWYGGDPAERVSHLKPFPRCSYWHDVPREQWPDGVDPLDYIPLMPVGR